jgi:hypothetical protein
LAIDEDIELYDCVKIRYLLIVDECSVVKVYTDEFSKTTALEY